jgi:hypothetical protein
MAGPLAFLSAILQFLVVPFGKVENNAPTCEVRKLRRQAALAQRDESGCGHHRLVGEILTARPVFLFVILARESQTKRGSIA